MPESREREKIHPMRKWWFWILILVVIPTFLFGVGILLFNHQAEKEFHQHIAELKAMGESLAIADLSPAPVEHPSRNFAVAPIVQALVNPDSMVGTPQEGLLDNIDLMEPSSIPGWGIDGGRANDSHEIKFLRPWVLGTKFSGVELDEIASVIVEHCSKIEHELQLFRAATLRPESNFNHDYTSGATDLKFDELSSLRSVADILNLQARAALSLNDSETAFANATALLRLSYLLGQEPPLLHQLVSTIIFQSGIEVVREGLHNHSWNQEQLEGLATTLESHDFEVTALKAFRMERAFMIQGFMKGTGEARREVREWFESPRYAPLPPKGYFHENATLFSSLLQEELLTDATGGPRYDSLPTTHHLGPRLKTLFSNSVKRLRHFHTSESLPMFSAFPERFLRTQTFLEHARIAILLESAFLREAQYPSSIDTLPADITYDRYAADLYRYQRIGLDNYMIYSIGSNRVDDGGLLRRATQYGDWVWLLRVGDNFDYADYRKNH